MRHWQVLTVVVSLVMVAAVFLAARQFGTWTPPEITSLDSASSPHQPPAEPGTPTISSSGPRQPPSTPSAPDRVSGLTFETCPTEPFRKRSLLDASPVEIAEYAFHYTCQMYRVLGSPTILRLSRLVTQADLPSLGLSGFYFYCNEPGLSLVIFQGDFDMVGMPFGAGGPYPRQTRVPFIGYIFNHRVGLPQLTALSAAGGEFKIALNDPSLPDDPLSLLPTGQPGSVSRGAPTAPLAPTSAICGTPTPGPTSDVPVPPAPTWGVRTRVPSDGTPYPYPVPTRR